MIPRIKELLHSTPFSPFTVRTSDGREYTVPTPDHAAVNPKGTYVVLFSDNDSHADVAGFHVAAVVKQSSPTQYESQIPEMLGQSRPEDHDFLSLPGWEVILRRFRRLTQILQRGCTDRASN